jgi:hypothetical protein
MEASAGRVILFFSLLALILLRFSRALYQSHPAYASRKCQNATILSYFLFSMPDPGPQAEQSKNQR